MPLDEFQKSVLRTLKRLRSPASVFAGGAVLQRHGFRRSDDQDIFHPAGGRVAETAARDAAALREAGFTVEVQRPYGNGGLVDDLDAICADAPGIQAIAAERGGTWPSDPAIDDTLTARVIAAFGRDGSKSGAVHDPAEPGPL